MILILFLIALIPRIISISFLPPSLNWDEVSHGYNAYSLLSTGKDEWGHSLPLIFQAYGDYKLPLYVYLTTIPVAIFGLNPLSVRLISILAGSLLPIVIYFFLKKFISSTSAFITSLVIALSPWSIFLSRIAVEANLFLFLYITSLYFLSRHRFAYSTFFYALSLLTYNSSRVLIFPYFLATFFIARQQHYSFLKNLPKFIFPALVFVVVLIQSSSPAGQARYQWVSILDSGAINHIEQLRQKYPRILVNKVTYFTYQTTKNYLAHFNPAYLFLNGGSHYQFNIPQFYLISPLLIPFLLLGFLALKKYPLILFFLLVSPLPSAITRDAPQILRSLAFLPLISMVIGLGINHSLKNKPFFFLSLFFLFLTLVISQVQFWSSYQEYRYQYSQSWQYGHQQLVNSVKSKYSRYQKIIVTKRYGEPHEFFLFFWPWPPQDYQKNKLWDYHANWYWINGFDKFTFVNDWDIKDLSIAPSTLLVTSPGNFPSGSHRLLETINFLDGQPAFDLISYE